MVVSLCPSGRSGKGTFTGIDADGVVAGVGKISGLNFSFTHSRCSNQIDCDAIKTTLLSNLQNTAANIQTLDRPSSWDSNSGQSKQAIASDTQPPSLRILGKYTEDESGVFEGSVTDNVEVAELLVNGRPIAFDSSGRFTHKEYLPLGGSEFIIVAIDRAGLKTSETSA